MPLRLRAGPGLAGKLLEIPGRHGAADQEALGEIAAAGIQKGELRPESKLTGVFIRDETIIDPNAVMIVIEDAREEEIQRQLRLVAEIEAEA